MRYWSDLATLRAERTFGASNGGWMDYATTFYRYQETVGFAHAPLPDLEERAKTVLRPNGNAA